MVAHRLLRLLEQGQKRARACRQRRLTYYFIFFFYLTRSFNATDLWPYRCLAPEFLHCTALLLEYFSLSATHFSLGYNFFGVARSWTDCFRCFRQRRRSRSETHWLCRIVQNENVSSRLTFLAGTLYLKNLCSDIRIQSVREYNFVKQNNTRKTPLCNHNGKRILWGLYHGPRL